MQSEVIISDCRDHSKKAGAVYIFDLLKVIIRDVRCKATSQPFSKFLVLLSAILNPAWKLACGVTDRQANLKTGTCFAQLNCSVRSCLCDQLIGISSAPLTARDGWTALAALWNAWSGSWYAHARQLWKMRWFCCSFGFQGNQDCLQDSPIQYVSLRRCGKWIWWIHQW